MSARAVRNIALVATCATTIATFGAWLLPGGIGRLSVSMNVGTTKPINQPSKISPDRKAEPQAQLAGNLGQISEPPKKFSHPAVKRDRHTRETATIAWKDQSFTLEDQEQKTIVPGCASIAIEFNEVGKFGFVTVRISAGEDSTLHAISSAGERFKFTCGGNDYLVSILLIDQHAATIRASVQKFAH